MVENKDFNPDVEDLDALAKLGSLLFAGYQDTANKSKVAGVNLLVKLFEKHAPTTVSANVPTADVFNPDSLHSSIFSLLSRPAKSSPTLVGAANGLLGALCRHFPEAMARHSGRIKSSLLGQLNQQVESTMSKVDMPVVEGCLKGQQVLLISFDVSCIKY